MAIVGTLQTYVKLGEDIGDIDNVTIFKKNGKYIVTYDHFGTGVWTKSFEDFDSAYDYFNKLAGQET